MTVTDGSAVVDVLLREPGTEALAQRLLAKHVELHAPHVIDLEVIQALRKACRAGSLDWARASQLLDDFDNFRLIRHPHWLFLSRIWELRNNMTAYDAAYVALAESLDAPLVTRDKRLATAPGHRARIELV